MRVLVTADTVGGVWTYTEELVTGLLSRGIEVTLVSFGGLPSASQMKWIEELPRLDYRPTSFMLEWMQDSEESIWASRLFLEAVVSETRPDLLHLSQYCYGDLPVGVPRVVVGHSDVGSWWRAVRSQEPPEDAWFSWYSDTVVNGLRAATAVITPSHWMMNTLNRQYGPLENASVVYNGRDPNIFNARLKKEGCALCVGRLWDEGKNVALLTSFCPDIPVNIVGETEAPANTAASMKLLASMPNIRWLGPKAESELLILYAYSSIYIATSCYEPFGLAPLEAALSGCALLLSDISSFRELWGDAALYFQCHDTNALQGQLRRLSSDLHLQSQYGELAYQHARKYFTADRMVQNYVNIYKKVCSMKATAA